MTEEMCESYKLEQMKLGDEIILDTALNNTKVLVRKVINGFLYTYIKYQLVRGEYKGDFMTTTFVPD